MLKQKLANWVKFVVLFFLALLTIFPSAASATDLYQALETPFYDATSSTGECSTTTLTGSDHEEQTWNYFKAKGLSDEQTAGIMGNMLQESHFDPLIKQGGGDSRNPSDADPDGWGLIQWTPGSKVINEAKEAGVSGPIYELSTQLDLVWQHMHNNPIVTQSFDLSYFKTLSSEVDAAIYFGAKIEGFGIAGNRFQDATDILKKYSGSAANSSNSSAGCSSDLGGANSGSCDIKEPVYSAQYSQEQLAQIFGSPGSANAHPDLHLVTASFLGFQAQVSPLVAPCLEAVSQQIQSEHIDYKVTQFGCYRFDSDNGSSNIGLRSYHTYGAACDINWGKNPFVADGSPAPHDMPQQYISAFHDHGFTWGGDWHSVKDYMHFEWHGVVPK